MTHFQLGIGIRWPLLASLRLQLETSWCPARPSGLVTGSRLHPPKALCWATAPSRWVSLNPNWNPLKFNWCQFHFQNVPVVHFHLGRTLYKKWIWLPLKDRQRVLRNVYFCAWYSEKDTPPFSFAKPPTHLYELWPPPWCKLHLFFFIYFVKKAAVTRDVPFRRMIGSQIETPDFFFVVKAARHKKNGGVLQFQSGNAQSPRLSESGTMVSL